MSYLRILPKVDLAISPLLQEELPKQLSDPSTFARKPHPSDFPGFTEVTDQLHRALVAISSYSTKGPEETEEVTQSRPTGTETEAEESAPCQTLSGKATSAVGVT